MGCKVQNKANDTYKAIGLSSVLDYYFTWTKLQFEEKECGKE